MCAIGSGVAPFLGIIAHKQAQLASNLPSSFKSLRLVYGYRQRHADAIALDFLEQMLQHKILNELDCIESHNKSPKYYVQHYLTDRSHIIDNDILEDDAVFYACG